MKIFIGTKICLILVIILLNSKFFDPVNKKVIGKLKDEFRRKIINRFIGLKSKKYSLIGVDDEEVTKAKGVNKKKSIKNLLMFCSIKKVITHKMKRIQSKLHRIGTHDACKISLSCFDDKRYVLDDRVNTLAYFHKNMKDKSDKEFIGLIKN